jgi:hypothetical protein
VSVVNQIETMRQQLQREINSLKTDLAEMDGEMRGAAGRRRPGRSRGLGSAAGGHAEYLRRHHTIPRRFHVARQGVRPHTDRGRKGAFRPFPLRESLLRA